MRLTFFFIISFSLLYVCAFAQNKENKIDIVWKPTELLFKSDKETKRFMSFENAVVDAAYNYLPAYLYTEKIAGNPESINAELVNTVFEPINKEEIENVMGLDQIKGPIVINTSVGYDKKQAFVLAGFVPIQFNESTGGYEKLISGQINISHKGSRSSRSVKVYSPFSVLSTDEWFKIGVTKDGIYKMDYNFIKNMGLNPDEIDPRNLKIYGNGGGMIPFANNKARIDDIIQNSIFVNGESDGKFDSTDYILFYGQDPNRWTLNTDIFVHHLNLYSDTTFYFISVSPGPGKRIQNKSSLQLPATHSVTSFDDYSFHDKEVYNLIKSGRVWYGEKFDYVTSYDFSFSFPNIDLSSPISIKADFAARSASESKFTTSAAGASMQTSIALTNFANYNGPYANQGQGVLTFLPQSSNISVNINYNKPNSSSMGWLNYLQINARRELRMHGNQMIFRDKKSFGAGNIAEFNLVNTSPGVKIWDVTYPYEVMNQNSIVTGPMHSFKAAADSIREYIAFNSDEFYLPSFSGKVVNQNLHGIGHPEMVIVSHPLFINQAHDLAVFHKTRGLSVEVVSTESLYNEFSSGAPDVSAIRDFMKMIYDRAANQNELPKYLLLFGDGSFDNKGKGFSNTNFILSYQSLNSLAPTSSYVSDDFFGLLDDDEGDWLTSNELVDIGIGRFPVKSVAEAQNVVKKVKSYYEPKTMRDWRNFLCFIADDQDNNLHFSQAEFMANNSVKNKNYNIDKIFLDAYQQISTPGGKRFPDVNEAINRRFEKGALIINYTGHGGEIGLAEERIISIPQINSWKNSENLPLFVTATCEFTRFDDPSLTSAGEHVFLNPNGGAIALFTTVRLVYAGPNFDLNKHLYNYAFEKIDGRKPTLGDLFRLTKMASAIPGGINNRNFTFIGDPSVELAYPKHKVITSTINGNAVSTVIDTIKALQKVTITGFVSDDNGQKLTGFNGIVYPTVFDKPSTIKTLGNDSESPVTEFKLQKNVVYKGKVSVKNGDFSFTFIVPKDIGYNFGKGRISYYAENTIEDAQGYFDEFYIGGTEENAALDATGPEVDLYLNNDKFVFGGVTDEKPKLLAYVKDESGINTVGNGIGHDLVAVLDENTDRAIVLNDYYEAELDSYQKGVISYPFSKLEEGNHTLRLKVWDVYNNSNEAFTEFVVANSAELALKHVLNYPNPFTTYTEFNFEHNQPGMWLDVQVQIFTVSGKLIKTLNTSTRSDGFRAEPIPWNGMDDFGDKIGRGVYIYRLKVRANDGSVAEKIEKLVILN
ncbi:MAG: type IX secretion system sortase PorU [Bacteroidetes bacterium]|nr:type IX secretion system sortase PorU [Bacteroidota bacterium]HET6245981.1 type IX secretion system sortase PorU [Bacteroidia bacterium]